MSWFDSLDSTNNAAERDFEAIDNMSIIATKMQTEGRGQGENKWHSTYGSNLTFSLVLHFEDAELKSKDQILLTCFITLAITDLLSEYGIDAGIKWPNDIWVDGKKICGILIWNKVCGEYITGSIVGVGLNVNETEFPEDLPNPTSMKAITGKTFDCASLLEKIAKKIRERYTMIFDENQRVSLETEFNKKMFTLL